jgi:ankyrin repeat protein
MSLHNAAERGNLPEVRRLVNAGASVNARNHERMTPLMKAARRGHANVIRYLLNKGANARARMSQNNTRSAIHLAAEEGHLNAVRSLVRHSNLKAQDGNGRSVLTIAAGIRNPEMLRMLIRAGARPNNMMNEYLTNNTNKNRRNLIGAALVKWSIAKRTIPATLRAGMKARKNRNLAMRQQLGGANIQTGSTSVKGLPPGVRNLIGMMVRGRKQ